MEGLTDLLHAASNEPIYMISRSHGLEQLLEEPTDGT